MSNAQKISRSEILQARRQVLITRCRLQRQQLIWQSAELHHELRFIELGLNAARTLRASPLLVATLAVVTAGLALIKPRRTLWLVKTGFSSWRLWRRFAPALMPLIPVLRDWLVSARKTNMATNKDTQTKE
ncbi:YqjK family protein [Undibacterium flavidum]|uniref:YqjK-like protein n=1 Tax=Undibacterium flavidum TaxID=2762297 RepID=A0ABR6YC04_9BURK|nr:YqjK family protein [Undibacterium flavidum]MBC3873939.1 hypothetical protein [Undibacterium flavidum]